MSYVRKLGASALVITAAFAVAFAVLISSSSTQTAEAADVELADDANSATAAPGDTVQIVVTGEFARVSITELEDGVGASFDHNDGQSVGCADDGACDTDDADNGSVEVDLNIDADSGEGYILLSVGGLGAASATKVVNVSKATLVGSLKIEAATKTIDAGTGSSVITATVKNASATPGPLDRAVSFITTLGNFDCDGTRQQVCSIDTDGTGDAAGTGRLTLHGGGVEGVATVTATLGSLTQSLDVTLFGDAENLTAEPQQGSVEIGGSVYVVLTVTDAAGNPVAEQVIEPASSKEVVGPDDDAVLVVTETATPADGDNGLGVGYSKDFIHATDATKNIPACGDDNTGSAASPETEVFDTDGTNADGQCVVHVTAPKKADGAEADATRGEHTLNFAIGTLKASATIEVAGSPASITTDAPERVDPASVTEITVSVWDDEDVLVGITSVTVRKVGGDGLIEDQGEGNSEMTSDGQSKFTFVAPSTTGSSEILISAGDVDHRVTLQIGEAMPEPDPEPEVATLSPAPSGAVTLTSFSGGSVDDLAAALSECGDGAAAHASVDGGWVSYVPAAVIPAANAPFNTAFADGVPAGQILQVTNCN